MLCVCVGGGGQRWGRRMLVRIVAAALCRDGVVD